MGSIEFKVSGVKEITNMLGIKKNKIKPVIKSKLGEIGKETLNYLKEKTPIKTGKLRRAEKMKQPKYNEVMIYIDGKMKGAKYADFIEGGTKAHMIRPVNGKALKFKSGGKVRFSRGHMVKGIKAVGMFEKTRNYVDKNINDLIIEIGDEILKD